MIKSCPGKIFLEDQRGLIESDSFRRLCTFSFGSFSHDDKKPFNGLFLFNDEVLAATATLKHKVIHGSQITIIPVTGELTVKCNGLEPKTIDVQEYLVLNITDETEIELINPYDDNCINFLLIGIKKESAANEPFFRNGSFDFATQTNQLINIEDSSVLMHIGLFEGRKETVYTLRNPEASIFAFVIAGAFEFEGRLLHERDGLALWDTSEVELEALSNHAIVLVLELAKQG